MAERLSALRLLLHFGVQHFARHACAQAGLDEPAVGRRERLLNRLAIRVVGEQRRCVGDVLVAVGNRKLVALEVAGECSADELIEHTGPGCALAREPVEPLDIDPVTPCGTEGLRYELAQAAALSTATARNSCASLVTLLAIER